MTRSWRVSLVVALMLVSGSPAAGAECQVGMPDGTGHCVIDAPSTIQDVALTLTRSLLIRADDVTLRRVSITCRRGHRDPAIRVEGADRFRLWESRIRGCGGGVHIQGGRGHDLAEGHIPLVRGTALRLDAVTDSRIIGWRIRLAETGIELAGASRGNILAASFVVARALALSVSAESGGNQIIRNRFRPAGDARSWVARSDNPDNLWRHVICERAYPNGMAACIFSQQHPPPPAELGDPTAFAPRLWTVCRSRGRQRCDFVQPGEAIQAARPGDWVVVDTLVEPPVAVVLDRPLWLIGNTQAQKGTFGSRVRFLGLSVVVPGETRLENLRYGGPAVPASVVQVGVENEK